MILLSFDSGAERMGWACLEDDGKKKGAKWHGSGISTVKRRVNGSKAEPFQKYRLRLIDFWIVEAERLLKSYKPDEVVSEIIPAVGGGNFVVATQSQLAAAAITVVQTVVRQHDLPLGQVAGISVKAKIGGKKTATKVGVRNGVIELIPRLADRKPEWTVPQAMDEPDAIGVGLTYLGYAVKR